MQLTPDRCPWGEGPDSCAAEDRLLISKVPHSQIQPILDHVVFGRCLVKKPTCKWTHTIQTCVIQLTMTFQLAL